MYKNKKQEEGAVKNQKNFLSNKGLKSGHAQTSLHSDLYCRSYS